MNPWPGRAAILEVMSTISGPRVGSIMAPFGALAAATVAIAAQGEAEKPTVNQSWYDGAPRLWLGSAADRRMAGRVAIQGRQAR